MAIKKSEKIWHNGKLIPWDSAKIHVMSHVVNYGSSVFEGIMRPSSEESLSAVRGTDAGDTDSVGHGEVRRALARRRSRLGLGRLLTDEYGDRDQLDPFDESCCDGGVHTARETRGKDHSEVVGPGSLDREHILAPRQPTDLHAKPLSHGPAPLEALST